MISNADDIFGMVLVLLGVTFMTYYGIIALRQKNRNSKR